MSRPAKLYLKLIDSRHNDNSFYTKNGMNIINQFYKINYRLNKQANEKQKNNLDIIYISHSDIIIK